MKRAAGAALLALALAGCVAAPKKLQPELGAEVPDAWTARADLPAGEIESEWWYDFDDASLPGVVQQALERNLDLVAAVARMDRAAAEARIAGADLKPSAGVGLSATRQESSLVFLPGAQPGDSLTFSRSALSFDVSWEIDLWGRIRAGARAAVADFQASEADLRAARQSIAAQAAKLWFRVLESGQQVALAEETVRSFELSAGQVRRRFESGVRPALDLRLALSNLAGAQALADLRRTELDIAVRQLEVLLGRYPDRSILDAYPPENLPSFPEPVPAGLPAELIARRPDLVAAERRLAATDQRHLAARRALYPRLSLTGSAGTVSDELGDLLDGDFGVWSLVAGLTQPLFQGGRLRAGVDRAEALGDEALAVYAASVLDAFAEVETSLAAEAYLAQRELHLAETARQLVAARRLAEDRYRSGIGIYLVVLDSQTRALTAESQLLVVRRQRLNNRVDLHLALGGGFETAPDVPAAGITADQGDESS